MAATTYNENNNAFTTQGFVNPTLSGPITVTQDGLILTTSGGAIDLSGGAYKLTVNGHVVARAALSEAIAISASPVGNTLLSTVTVGGTAVIGAEKYGIHSSWQALNLNNAGRISSINSAVKIDGTLSVASTITNSGTIASDANFGIDLQGLTSGNVTINNSGFIIGGIIGGQGIENVTNSFYIAGSMNLGIGNDIAMNTATGMISQNVDMGDGNDKFTNNGTVGGTISMGAGDDTFIGGAKNDFVYDDSGKDSYKLGDGLDRFIACNALHSNSVDIDTVDGGANTGINPKLGSFGDYYDATSATSGLQINLDTAIQKDIVTLNNYAANTAVGTDIGTDKVYNFEIAGGGSGNDIIFGNASANKINGNAGADTLYGLNGDDVIDGGTGADNIFGGAGADKLSGSSSVADHEIDKFYFTKLTDSTVALAGRDTITYFEDTKDLIDLSKLALGASTSVLTGATDVFPGGGAGHAAVRVVSTHEGWTIQVDSNGDKKIDMAIDVNDASHTITWDASDFVFV